MAKFGRLYTGQVDFAHLGLDGTPVNERWLPDEHLAAAVGKTVPIHMPKPQLSRLGRMESICSHSYWCTLTSGAKTYA